MVSFQGEPGPQSVDVHVVYLEESVIFIREGRGGLTHVLSKPLIKSLEREEIIQYFAFIEVLLNELIRIELQIGLGQTEKIFDFLATSDAFNKVRLLEDWEVITGAVANRLHKTRKVRNQLAHHWDGAGFSYAGVYVGREKDKEFDTFVNDFQEAWNGLADAYMRKQPSIEMLIEYLKKSFAV